MCCQTRLVVTLYCIAILLGCDRDRHQAPSTSLVQAARLDQISPERARSEVLARCKAEGLLNSLIPATRPPKWQIDASFDALNNIVHPRDLHGIAKGARTLSFLGLAESDPARAHAAQMYQEVREVTARPDPSLARFATRDLIRRSLFQTQQTIDGVNPRPVSDLDAFAAHGRSVCLLANINELEDMAVGGIRRWKSPKTFAKKRSVCQDVPNAKNVVIGFGTGFLVRNNRIVTAGHNFDNIHPSDVCVIFNFRYEPDGTTPLGALEENIFRITRIRLVSNAFEDWAVAELDRMVNQPGQPDRFPIAVMNNDDAQPPQLPLQYNVRVLGHPEGLPLSDSGPGRVLRHAGNYFITPVSTYDGNSGSPVLGDNGVVMGILKGAGSAHRIQYIGAGPCVIPKNYTSDSTNGELCMRVSLVVPHIDGALDNVER